MPKKLPKYLTVEEIRSLFGAVYKTDIKYLLIMKFMYKCGCRGAEVTNIYVRDINAEERKLNIIQGKGNQDRIVPIPLDFLIEIEKYIKVHDLQPNDKVFDITTGGIRDVVKRYGERAGLQKKINPHMLRHSFAVHSLKSGRNLRSLQLALGHKQLSTTQIYLDITGQDLQEDFEHNPLPV